MKTMHDLLKAYRRRFPDQIPVSVGVDETCWKYYDREDLLSVLAKHWEFVPNYEYYEEFSKNLVFVPWRRKGIPYTDSWGCE